MTTSASSTTSSTGAQPPTLLVANRGEIALRVFRTARSMGMRTVAVFVDADADAPFVAEADEAMRLPNGYLDIDGVIAAATATGATHIHPGYGFLSENAAFATAVIDAGVRWVGPSPEVIGSMGDKLAAKAIAEAAGVPTLPSSETASAEAAESIGYPVLIKAAAGGGGKGMRVVEQPTELDEAIAAARREAQSGFGDDRVFLERYVARSRHVEIQVLGDHHGTVVHLGERECSIQRRHQKIIEESPSPVVDDAMRTAMGDAALALAREMRYSSAGTVEFLVDDDSREFFFLEVNTRLQVEHPVTEEVTGVDLVREQLRVADGEPVSFSQNDLAFSGHAIEARLYAEDPSAGFLPATGTLHAFAPASEPAVRWDSGVERGSVVGVDFDPMLAKVIATGPTRAEAAGRLALALERLHLGGVTTNRDFLAATLRHPAFLSGDTTTDFIDRVAPPAMATPAPATRDRVLVAVALWLQGGHRAEARVQAGLPTGFRIGRLPDEQVLIDWPGAATGESDSASVPFRVVYRAQRDGSFVISGCGPVPTGDTGETETGAINAGDTPSAASSMLARVHEWSPCHLDVEIDGYRTSHQITRSDDALFIDYPGGTATLSLIPRFTVPGTEVAAGGLTAPMPGVVLSVRAAVGDTVTAGQTLVVLEAMKMEHHINAPADGVVAELPVAEGDQVDNGAVLVRFEPTDAGEGSNDRADKDGS